MRKRWTEIVIIIMALILIPVIVDTFAAWDNDKPADAQSWNTAASSIRANNDALEVELGIDLNEAHPYYQSAAPTTKPDGSTALDVDDNGRLWIDSDDNTIYILTDYSGPTWTSAAASGNVSSADATFTLQNTDEEDSDGGRQSRWINKGEQSGGEATTLGYVEFNHDGTGDDEKGQFVIKLNDGDDTDAPSNQPIGYLSTGKIDVSSSLSVLDEDDLSSDDDEVVATQQSIKAYIDDKVTYYDTGWISNNDWTNVHLGTTAINNNVVHSLTANLSDLIVRVLLSTDGTDNNSFEIARGFHFEDGNARDSGGITVYQVDTANIKVQTGAVGICIIDDSGANTFVDSETWYYKVKVWRLQ